MACRGAWLGRVLLLLTACWVLPSCGFHPLYGDSSNSASVQAQLAQINVPLLPEHSGQLMRAALQERLERGGSGQARRYDLSVGIGISGDAVGIQADSSVTRIRLIGTANWTLSAQNPQRSTIASGSAHNTDGYNILDQQYFASDQESDAVQRRMIDALAEQITLQLAAYFDKHPNPQP